MYCELEISYFRSKKKGVLSYQQIQVIVLRSGKSHDDLAGRVKRISKAWSWFL